MKIIISVCVVFIGVLGFYFFPNKDKQSIDASYESKIVKTFEPSIQKELLKTADINMNYRQEIKREIKDYKLHQKIAEDLHNLAFTNAFYKKERIKILLMAKEHLIASKELRIK